VVSNVLSLDRMSRQLNAMDVVVRDLARGLVNLPLRATGKGSVCAGRRGTRRITHRHGLDVGAAGHRSRAASTGIGGPDHDRRRTGPRLPPRLSRTMLGSSCSRRQSPTASARQVTVVREKPLRFPSSSIAAALVSTGNPAASPFTRLRPRAAVGRP
jgi:hypothetical protein